MKFSFNRARSLVPAILSAMFLLAFATTAQVNSTVSPLPAPTGHLNDYAGVIDSGTKQQIEKDLRDFKSKTGIEIAVAVVRTTEGRDIFEYSRDVARGWGIGSKADDNPGVLLFIAIDDRKYYSQISRDLEDELPDGVAGSLQRQFLVPEFRKGNYSKGIADTVAAYIAAIEYKQTNPAATPHAGTSEDDEGISQTLYNAFCCLVILGVIFLIIWSNRGGNSKKDRGRWGGGGFGGGSSAALPWVIGSILTSGGSSSSGNDWTSGGGSDWGGFGGGGDFGGGGAGGGW